MAKTLRCAIVLSAVFLATEILNNAVAVELRCYCNLPACVHTAYMCKSEIGCFQELPAGPRSEHGLPRIGCLELWTKDRPFRCLQLSTDIHSAPPFTTTRSPYSQSKHKRKKSFLRCCLEDMCNYVPQESEVNAQLLENDEVSVSVEGNDPVSTTSVDQRSSSENISDRVWFRAAVIAVPIFGGIILVILIVLACTLLRSDWRKVSDEDRLLAPPNNCGESERCVSPGRVPIQPKCERLPYQQPKPFPGYLRGQLRHYHSDTTLVICSEKAKDRPNTVLFSPRS